MGMSGADRPMICFGNLNEPDWASDMYRPGDPLRGIPMWLSQCGGVRVLPADANVRRRCWNDVLQFALSLHEGCSIIS